MDAASPSPPMDADPAPQTRPLGMQEEVRRQHDSLRVLSDETGGFASINSNDFAAAFDRIQHDNSSVLRARLLPGQRAPGRPVPEDRGQGEPTGRRGPLPQGLRRATRKAGRDPAGRRHGRDAADPARPAGQPAADAGASADGHRRAVQGHGAKTAAVRIVVQADGRDLTFTKKDGKLEGTLDLAVIAVDGQSGKDQGRAPLLVGACRSQPASQAAGRRDRGPGHVARRPAAGNATSCGSARPTPSASASARCTTTWRCPTSSAGPLTMSGVVLSSCARGPDSHGRRQPGRRSSARRCPGRRPSPANSGSGEELALVAEVYDNESKTPHTVDITTSLQSDDGRVVYTHEDSDRASELGGSDRRLRPPGDGFR